MWPKTRVLCVRSLAVTTCLLTLLQGLANATTHTSTQSSRHAQITSERKHSHSPVDSVSDDFRRLYARVINGQLGLWGMVLLSIAFGSLGIFGAGRRKRGLAKQNGGFENHGCDDTKKADEGTGERLTEKKQSITDARVTDPGLLRKHSSLRSYTTSFGTYPVIRVFKREHPQADKLPSKPTPLPLMVFIHGLGGSLAQFHPLLTSLVNVAPCLGVDLPGCGLSSFSPTTWAAYSQEALVELLARVIAEDCQGHDDQGVVLIGHSMGSSLCALLAATDSPLRAMGIEVLGLVAICPKATTPSDREMALYRRILHLPTPVLDVWRSWDRRGGPESASVARFVGQGADAETKKLQERFNIQSKSAVWRRMAWGVVCNGRKADLATWSQLTVPIFLIGAESDNITSPKEVSAISHVLGKNAVPNLAGLLASTTPSDAQPVATRSDADGVTRSSNTSHRDQPESNTETTILENQSLGNGPDPKLSFSKKKRVLKTTILPAPAAHSLLYDPTTYRTLAGLIQKFLWDHVDSRLSLGWQLQHLSTEGKWDVKNLAKWQAVRPVSEPIAGLFRAMKTLREVDEAHCPEIFVRNWKGKLKAVVDISYENPVYDPRGLDAGGIEYHKFPTVSKIPPTTDEVQDFIKLIDRIRRTDSPTAAADALIGVHCHYGFNRTGFFICSYLIERERYGVQQAIDEFQAQRPPGIRHDHFLDTLFVRYCRGLQRAPTL
ncbi:MAG: hypothetical protein Q9184_000375 [Pyrenodesmia sp. 2 TL-2023]